MGTFVIRRAQKQFLLKEHRESAICKGVRQSDGKYWGITDHPLKATGKQRLSTETRESENFFTKMIEATFENGPTDWNLVRE